MEGLRTNYEVFKVDGSRVYVYKETLTLEDLQEDLGGSYVEVVPSICFRSPIDKIVVVDEEALLKEAPLNTLAVEVLQSKVPLFGPVVVIDRNLWLIGED